MKRRTKKHDNKHEEQTDKETNKHDNKHEEQTDKQTSHLKVDGLRREDLSYSANTMICLAVERTGTGV